jgi:hypothetical protein
LLDTLKKSRFVIVLASAPAAVVARSVTPCCEQRQIRVGQNVPMPISAGGSRPVRIVTPLTAC